MVLHFNISQFNNRLNRLNEGKETIQNLIIEFKKLDINSIDIKSNFVSIIKEGESFIKSKIVESIDVPMFGGFRMKKKDFINTLELPDFTAFTEAHELCKEFEHDLQYFTFESGNVKLNAKELEALRERYSTVARSPEQLKLAKAHEQAGKALTALNNAMVDVLGGGRGLPLDQAIGRYFSLSSNEYMINELFYETNKHLFTK